MNKPRYAQYRPHKRLNVQVQILSSDPTQPWVTIQLPGYCSFGDHPNNTLTVRKQHLFNIDPK